MSYILRTDEGSLTATMSNRMAGRLLTQKGSWKEKRFTDGTRSAVFVFDSTFSYGDDLRIHVFPGYYLKEN